MATYRIDRDGTVATFTFTRDERLNAFDVATIREWRDAIDALLDEPDLRVLCITAEGRAFCAGGDVKAMVDVEDGKAHFRAMTEHHHALVRRLRTTEKLVVTAANGAIAGGGCGIFLAGDIRFATPATTMKPAYLTLGVSPDGGITHFLPRLVGIARAQEILFNDRRLDADEMVRLGLAFELVEPDHLMESVHRRAREWADGPRASLEGTKSLLQMTFDNPLSMQLAEERNLNGKSGATPEFRERLARFLTKG